MADNKEAYKERFKAAQEAMKRKDCSTAVKIVKEALEFNATSYEALNVLGDAQKGCKAYEESEVAYRNAIKADAKRERAYQGLRELFEEMHAEVEWDKCQETLAKLIEVLKKLIEVFKGDRQKRNMYEDNLKAVEKKKRGPSPPNRARAEAPAAAAPRKVPSKKNSGKREVVRGERKNVDYAADLYMAQDAPKPPAAPKANPNAGIVVKQSSMAAALKPKVEEAPKVEEPATVPFKTDVSEVLQARRGEVKAMVDAMMAQNGGDASKTVVALAGKIAHDKKKYDAEEREWALLGLEHLADTMGRQFEPYGSFVMPMLLVCLGDGKASIKPAAQGAMNAVVGRMHPESMRVLVPALLGGLEARDFKVKEATLYLFRSLAHHAPRQMEAAMARMYPLLQECLSDTHPKVQEAAGVALKALLTVVTQPEVQKIMKTLVPCILQPNLANIAACLDDLMETTFINVVNSCSLSILVPIIGRGLKEPSMDLNKKAATAAGNICALVLDSRDIWPFVPALLPSINKSVDHSHPDVRKAASRARTSLLEGAGLSEDEDSKDSATIATLGRSSSGNNLSGMSKSSSQGSLNVAEEDDRAKEVVNKAITAVVEALKGGSSLSDAMKEFINNVVAAYVADAREGMSVEQMTSELSSCIVPLLTGAADGDALSRSIADIAFVQDTGPVMEIPDADYIVRIEKIILAFAGKVLLKKANLLLERGHRYGVVGQNGMGKTTLLNRVAAQDINGFPKCVSTYYIQHEILSEGATSVFNFMESQVPEGTTREHLAATLSKVGFSDDMQNRGVTELSGGWRMKLAIARSMLWDADLLLLDEPTNHLDKAAVTYLENHLTNMLPNTTVCVVSHDYDFLQNVCTDIIHIAERALTYYRCTFKEFQEQRPEIVAGLPSPGSTITDALAAQQNGAGPAASADSSSSGPAGAADDAASQAGANKPEFGADGIVVSGKPMIFPDPGKLDGVVGRRKPVMRMNHVEFKYDTADTPVLTDASVMLCLSSRTALVGANGAGKTTLMKLLIGELNCTEGVGEVWRHHNLRLAYIAQHSMFHLEQALESTPLEYIQNRFYNSQDKEKMQGSTMKLTPEEKETMQERGEVNAIVGRQERGKKLWYECVKIGRKDGDTEWEPLQFLERAASTHVMKLVKAYDEKLKADASGMAIRPITGTEVRAHLADFGIDEDLAMGKIKRMSGGQKSRLVLAAAMWNKPHLISLDEPTNYLDNDTLAALTTALKNFKGGVVTISHNAAFVEQLCNEKWEVGSGTVKIVGGEEKKPKKEKPEKKK